MALRRLGRATSIRDKPLCTAVCISLYRRMEAIHVVRIDSVCWVGFCICNAMPPAVSMVDGKDETRVLKDIGITPFEESLMEASP